MIHDMAAILWKESREMLITAGGRSRWNLLLFVAVFGVFLPWQMGARWVSSPFALAYWVWVPLIMVNAVISDAFAGERERRTLETLLSSRLSDRAILFGKYFAAMLYGCGLTWIGLLAGLVTVNVVHWQGKLLLYPPLIGFGVIAAALLIAAFAAGLGILISLRASTVRQAQQVLSITTMVIIVLPVLVLSILPSQWTDRLAEIFSPFDVTRLVVLGCAIFLVVDLGLLALAMARFRRARLILD